MGQPLSRRSEFGYRAPKKPFLAVDNTKSRAIPPPHLALLEDIPHDRDQLRARLDSEEFLVLEPKSKEDCLDLLRQGCRTFILDIDLGPGREVEGLHTLRAIKKECPECFCAILSRDNTFEKQANEFGADWVGQKTDEDIDHLIEELNRLYLRRWLQTGQVTLRDVAVQLRSEAKALEEPASGANFGRVVDEITLNFEYIEARLREKDWQGATRKLILLEPGMRLLTDFDTKLGDGFGIAAHALENALVQHSGSDLKPEQWQAWRNEFERLTRAESVTVEEGTQIANELDKAGFNTEPPHWSSIVDIVNSLNDDDEASGSSTGAAE